jgi:hypothetical protein
VKTAAEEAAKDQTAHEKQAVGLEERRKHANTKAKKLKKTLQEVRSFIFLSFSQTLTNHPHRTNKLKLQLNARSKRALPRSTGNAQTSRSTRQT